MIYTVVFCKCNKKIVGKKELNIKVTKTYSLVFSFSIFSVSVVNGKCVVCSRSAPFYSVLIVGNKQRNETQC